MKTINYTYNQNNKYIELKDWYITLPNNYYIINISI